MPIVPRRVTPGVQTSPLALPSPSVPNGAGRGAGTDPVSRLVKQATAVQREERRRLSQARTTDAAVRFARGAEPLTQTMLQAKGPHAQQAADEARKSLMDLLDTITADLSQEDAEAFRASDGVAQIQAFETSAARHVSQQNARYADETLRSAVDASIEGVIGAVASGHVVIGADGELREAAVQQRAALAIGAIESYAEANEARLPLPRDEWIREATDEAVDRMHTAAIEGLLQRGAVPTARAYLTRHADELGGAARANLQAQVDRASKVHELDRRADMAVRMTLDQPSLFSADPDAPTIAQMEREALELADGIDDADDRAEVRRRIRERYQEQRRRVDAEREAEHEALERRLDGGATLTQLQEDPGWARITPAARRSLQKLAQQRAAGTLRVTDDDVFERLREQAATDPAGFARVNLREHRHQLDERDYDHLFNLRIAALSAQSEAAAKANGTTQADAYALLEDHRSLTSAIDDEFDAIVPKTLLGTDDTAEVKAARSRFQRSVAAAVQTEQARRGAKLTEREVVEIARGQLGAVVTGSGQTWWNPSFNAREITRPIFELNAADLVFEDDRDDATYTLTPEQRRMARIGTVLPVVRQAGDARSLGIQAATRRLQQAGLSRPPTEIEIAEAFLVAGQLDGFSMPTDEDVRAEALHQLRTRGLFE